MLALWMYSWTTTDWNPAVPTPAPTDTGRRSNEGGGGYERRTQDFWEVRERYLRRFAPKQKTMAPDEPIEKDNSTTSQEVGTLDRLAGGWGTDYRVLLLQQALDAALRHAQHAQEAATLQDAVRRAMQLHLDISQIQQQNYNRAIALLLLDAF